MPRDDPASSSILVVDDALMVREMLSRRLARRGFEVSGAASGREALAHCAERSPDLILMDVRLPDLDGLEVTRRLRAGGAAPSPLILAMSGDAEDEDRQRALAAGADGFVDKALPFPALLEAIRAALEAS